MKFMKRRQPIEIPFMSFITASPRRINNKAFSGHCSTSIAETPPLLSTNNGTRSFNRWACTHETAESHYRLAQSWMEQDIFFRVSFISVVVSAYMTSKDGNTTWKENCGIVDCAAPVKSLIWKSTETQRIFALFYSLRHNHESRRAGSCVSLCATEQQWSRRNLVSKWDKLHTMILIS